MLKRFFLKEQNILILIALNAFIIFLLSFKTLGDNLWLINIDHFFLLLFVLEAMVKIKSLGARAYFRDWWNIFDFFIILASFPTLLVYFFPFPDTSVLTVLRLFRLIRLVRFIRFMPHLDMIIAGLGRAIKASLFVLLALFLLNFILALFTCHFYSEIAPKYFGNPLIASYSIFQMFTVEGWNEIPGSIAEKLDNPLLVGVTRFYFVVIVLIGGIFGMSLANAIFVDEMTMDNNKELEKKIDQLQKQIAELKEIIKSR